MDVNHKHILTGSITEFLFFCKQVGRKPAWFIPLLDKSDVDRIPVDSVVILYGTYHKSKVYPLIQAAWDKKLISTKVILPDEIAT